MHVTHITFELGKVTDWLTAIGTVGAVIWALFLAREQKSEQLSIATTLSKDITAVLYNGGSQLVVVVDGAIQVGRIFPAQEFGQNLIWHEREFPKLLHPGEVHLLRIDVTEYVNYSPDQVYKLWVKRPRFDRAIFLLVRSATGKKFRYRFSKSEVARVCRKGT